VDRSREFAWLEPEKTVHFAFGKPLPIGDRGSEEHRQIVEFIQAKLKEWEEV